MFKKSLHFLAQQRKRLRNGIQFRLNESRTGTLVSMGRRALHDIDYGSREAVICQYRTLTQLMKENANTEYGRKYGFSEIHSVEEFRKRVPFTTYDDYEPYIRRMMDGEYNLLCARPPRHYAITSGSVGVPKYIPVSQMELDKYTKYTAVAAFGVADEYYRNTTGHGIPSGLGLNALELRVKPISDSEKNNVTHGGNKNTGVDQGTISGTVLKSMKDYIPDLLSSPWEIICPDGEMDMKYLKTRLALGIRNLAFMDSVFLTGLVDLMDYIRDNYEMLCRDIYYGRISKKVKVPASVRAALRQQLQPDPLRAKQLLREFRQGFDTPIIPRIWPRMSWVGGIGTGSFFPYVRRMRKYTGKSIPFNNMCYAASESFMAVARHMGDESYVLIPDGGFYEFIPIRGDYGDDPTRTLTIEELEVGEDYEIIITNLSGFYRYRIKDVVRVTGYYNEAPLLRFIYRKDQLVSIAGEKTNEEALRYAVREFSLEMGLHVNEYSVYADEKTSPGHYVLFIEPDRIVPKELHERCRNVMESTLMQANPAYGDMIRDGVLGPLEIIFLQQQTYQLYRDLMIMKGHSANQLKPVRIIDTPMKERFFFRLRENYEE